MNTTCDTDIPGNYPVPAIIELPNISRTRL